MSQVCITQEEFNRYRLKYSAEPECIAWNWCYEIWISIEGGQVVLTVFENGEGVDETVVETWQDVEDYIDAYILEEDREREDEIEERELELTEATEVFVNAVADDLQIDSEVIEECKEHFLEYLYRKFGLTIRRPMVLEDEEGEDFFEEYPYECMIFEDIPLYN